jgi:hypothetical protein
MRSLPTPPPRIAKLPKNTAGYPVPWFVAWIDGQPDFRVVGAGKIDDAVRFGQCWLCGGPLGANAAFVIGPMCAINRVSSEPPSHRDCAIYAATACPFLTTPAMRRRDNNLPDDAAEPDGIMIRRNPGVALVWVTRSWRPMPEHRLFDVGHPAQVLWFAEGREATRDETLAAIDSGMPLLAHEAEQDPRPTEALAALEDQYRYAYALIPSGGAR